MKQIALALTATLLASFSAYGLDAKTAGPNTSPLFSSDAPISFELSAPLKTLFANKDKTAYAAGFLNYQNLKIPVEIRVRGFYSLQECEFPKLLLKLDHDAVRGTVFEHNEKLDLGTHCFADKHEAGMAHPYREAMTYRWLNLSNMVGYSARPALIRYTETSTGETSPQFEGFLLENMNALLKRTHPVEIGTTYAKDQTHHRVNGDNAATSDDRVKYLFDGQDTTLIGSLNLARLYIFEGLLGNGDMFLTSLHNVKLIETGDTQSARTKSAQPVPPQAHPWTTVPMDFILSAIALGGRGGGQVPTLRDLGERSAEAQQNLQQIILDYQSQKDAFYQSLSILGDNDPQGLSMAKYALDRFFAGIEALRVQ